MAEQHCGNCLHEKEPKDRPPCLRCWRSPPMNAFDCWSPKTSVKGADE